MKIGYHYTSWNHWLKIKKYGLRPQFVYKEELASAFPQGTIGIWVWRHALSRDEHVMSLLYQLAFRKQTRIVKLRVKYDKLDTLKLGPDFLFFDHAGMNSCLGDWTIPNDKRQSVIVTKEIPPAHIELIGDYDIKKLLG